jgi:hypothetical protein
MTINWRTKKLLKRHRRRYGLRFLLYTFVLALFFLLINRYVVQIWQQRDHSMQGILSQSKRVPVCILPSCKFPTAGEVVLLTHPVYPNPKLLRYTAATPGDYLELRSDSLWLNQTFTGIASPELGEFPFSIRIPQLHEPFALDSSNAAEVFFIWRYYNIRYPHENWRLHQRFYCENALCPDSYLRDVSLAGKPLMELLQSSVSWQEIILATKVLKERYPAQNIYTESFISRNNTVIDTIQLDEPAYFFIAADLASGSDSRQSGLIGSRQIRGTVLSPFYKPLEPLQKKE